MQKKLSVTYIKNNFEQVLDSVFNNNDIVVIERHKKAAAAMIPYVLYQRWEDKLTPLSHQSLIKAAEEAIGSAKGQPRPWGDTSESIAKWVHDGRED